MLAYHFHHQIMWQVLIAPFVILVGVLGGVDAFRSDKPRRLVLLGVGVLVAIAGVLALAETPALRHNHLCHAHSSDDCDLNHAANVDDHTHWFGGRAARPR